MTLDELAAVLDRLHRHKTVGYGNAWRKRGEVLSIFTNIARKYDRLEVALDQAVSSSDERLIDTAADLTVYAGKYLTWLAEQQPTAFDQITGQPFADQCSDAVGPDGLREVLRAMTERGSTGRPASQAEAWQSVRTAFAILERGLMNQADPSATATLTYAQKTEATWELMVNGGLLTIAIAAGDASALADWLAEIDVMDRRGD
jgi:hypothetical protein